MGCKGICERYKAERHFGIGLYVNGRKRCQVCEVYLEWDGYYCPCCRHKLRTKPHNGKYKIKMREIKPQDVKPIPIG